MKSSFLFLLFIKTILIGLLLCSSSSSSVVNAIGITNPLNIEKISLEQNLFLNSTCSDGSTTFTYQSSWVIKVCNEACGLVGVNLLALVDNVFSNLTDIVISEAIITPLSELTIQNSQVISPILFPTDLTSFQLLNTSVNNTIPLCDDPMNPNPTSKSSIHLTRDKLSTVFNNNNKLVVNNLVVNNNNNNNNHRLGRAKSLSSSSQNVEFYHEYPLFLDSEKLKQTLTCTVDNTSCLVYRIDIIFTLTTIDCPTTPILITNNINTTARLCDCPSVEFFQGYLSPLDANDALQQCLSNKTFCAQVNATTVLPQPTFSVTNEFNCFIVEDICTSCNPNSTCQYSRVRCVEVDVISGEIPVHISKTLAENALVQITLLNATLVSSDLTCQLGISGTTVSIPEPCCFSGHSTATLTVDYCVLRTDVTIPITFVVEGSSIINQCNSTDIISIDNSSVVIIPIQQVDFTIVKTADDSTPFLCPDNSSFPNVPANLCKNYTITVNVNSGCLSEGNFSIVDDIAQFASLGATLTPNSLLSSASLTCSQLNQSFISCTSNSVISSADNPLIVSYQLCLASCPFCNATTRSLSIENIATASYIPQDIIHTAVLNTTLVCPCPSCTCNVTVNDVFIEGIDTDPNGPGLSIEANGGSLPNHYYQGSTCTIYRANDSSVLGQFVYGAYEFPTLTSGWDCVSPTSNFTGELPQPPNNCICDRPASSTNPPHRLKCALSEVVNIVCCASPALPTFPIFANNLEFVTCNGTTNATFNCPVLPAGNFSMTGPFVQVLSFVNKVEEAEAEAAVATSINSHYNHKHFNNPRKLRASIDCNPSGVSEYQITIAFHNSRHSPEAGFFSINSFNHQMIGAPTFPRLGNYTLVPDLTSWSCSSLTDITTCSTIVSTPPGGNTGMINIFIAYECSAGVQCTSSNTSPPFITPTDMLLLFDATMTSISSNIIARSFSDLTGCSN